MWTNNIDDADRLRPGDAIVSMRRRLRGVEESMRETVIGTAAAPKPTGRLRTE
jgi:hypothetical protein